MLKNIKREAIYLWMIAAFIAAVAAVAESDIGALVPVGAAVCVLLLMLWVKWREGTS